MDFGGIFKQLEDLADRWRVLERDRRAVTEQDAGADGLRFCAGELKAVIAEMDRATQTMTVPEYAALVVASPAAVRRWIHKGELEADQTPHGDWLIPRTARRKVPPRVRRRLRGIRNEIARECQTGG